MDTAKAPPNPVAPRSFGKRRARARPALPLSHNVSTFGSDALDTQAAKQKDPPLGSQDFLHPAMSAMRVSIVVCNYNYGHYIQAAVQSILDQTYPAHQVIVVDDGSTDDSLERIKIFGEKITLICKENGGQISAYNAGFTRVTGDIVVFLDSDDRLRPEALAHIARAFDHTPANRLQYKLRLIDTTGRPTQAVIPSQLSQGDKRNSVRRGLLFLAAPGSGNAYRVNDLRKLMPLPETTEERHGADFFTGYGMALLGDVAVIDQDLAEYRVHNQVDAANLCFGNAKLGMTEAEMLRSRFRRFRAWIEQRTGEALPATEAIADFSIEKQDFAKAIFDIDGYWRGLRRGTARLPAITRSIVYRDNAWWMKAGLLTWALVVLTAPRGVGMPLARYVCNPTSRTQRA